jgi:hypothetical protein
MTTTRTQVRPKRGDSVSPTRGTRADRCRPPNVCERIRAIRGQPNRGLRDLSATMAWMSASLRSLRSRLVRALVRREQLAVLATHQRLMKREERRGPHTDGDLADSRWSQERRPESAEQPVPGRQVRRSPARPVEDDELLLEQKILRDHRAHAPRATQLRAHDGHVQRGEQEIRHTRASVGQTSGATQRRLDRRSAERMGNSRPTGWCPSGEPHQI